jgi:FlaA1/EpsC-like NDP-sugar epimerase
VHTVPGYYELLAGKVAITRVRPLHLEDLLGRDVVEYDRAAHDRVQSIFRDRTILVTGAGGSIGSELCRQLSAIGPRQLLLVENNENNLFDIDNEVRGLIGERSIPCLADIRNERRLEEIFHEHRPEIVFHAAAFKHVPMMELHPTAAIDNNVRGTRVLTEVADRHGVERFLFVSTDKAVNPTNIMGASKRVAELIVQAKAATSTAKFCCVRFGNVLGSRGSVLHTFQRQLEAGGPITVTHPEVTRFFMTIPEAVRLVIQASAIGEGGEVFLLDMGKPVRIFDMARQMIQLAGFADDEVAVEIVGLRPGEKLYEELLRDDENSRCSSVDGVFVAKLASVDPRWVGKWVESLEQAARDNREGSIRQILASIADYQPMRAANDAPASSARKAA